MRSTLLLLLAALLLALSAVVSFAADRSLFDAARFSCGVKAGFESNGDESFAPEKASVFTAVLNPAWNLGVRPSLVAPLRFEPQTQQLAWEPGLSILVADQPAFQFFVRAGWGVYRDLDNDHGVEEEEGPMVAASAVIPITSHLAVELPGRLQTRARAHSAGARLSYLFGGGE